MTARAGVVGIGRVGRNHVEAFLAADDAELAAVAEVDGALLSDLGDHWEIPERDRYRDHAAMLAATDLDVVVVATPDRRHPDHVLDAARSAAAPSVVLCEKPLATTVGRADGTVAACEDAGVELVVNHSRRFAAAHRTLHDLLHDRALLGELRSAHLVAAPEFLNLGTHYVDLVCYLLDDRVRDVRGGRVEPVDAPDGVRYRGGGTLAMDGGTVAHLDPVPGSAIRLYLEGTDGRLSLPLSIAPDVDHDWEFWRVEGGSRTRASLPEPLGTRWRADVSGTHSTYEPGMVPAQPLFEAAAEHAAALHRGRAANAAPGSRAVHGLEVLTGLVVSAHTGSRVPVPLAGPLRDTPLVRDRAEPGAGRPDRRDWSDGF